MAPNPAGLRSRIFPTGKNLRTGFPPTDAETGTVNSPNGTERSYEWRQHTRKSVAGGTGKTYSANRGEGARREREGGGIGPAWRGFRVDFAKWLRYIVRNY